MKNFLHLFTPEGRREAFLERQQTNRILVDKKNSDEEKRLRQEAWLLWEADGKPDGKSDYYWQKAKERLSPLHQKLYLSVELPLERLLGWLNEQATFGILEILGSTAILVALISYIATERQRHDAEVYTAWQVITAADGKSGSGGRRRALEFLNATSQSNSSRRFPFFWLKWPAENLSGLSAPEAYLVGINLPDAELNRANLKGANLENSVLTYANLSRANLESANFWGADVSGAILLNANLRRAFLDADFSGAWLSEANLEFASLHEINLRQARLEGANLQGAYLDEAKLQGANLTDAKLQLAYLGEANLDGATIDGADFENSVYTHSTIFPRNFDPADAGMTLLETNEQRESYAENLRDFWESIEQGKSQ